jgi:hypothetical protein
MPRLSALSAASRRNVNSFEIYAVFGTVQYSPKGIGHTAEGHQPIEQDGVMMTGDDTAKHIAPMEL